MKKKTHKKRRKKKNLTLMLSFPELEKRTKKFEQIIK